MPSRPATRASAPQGANPAPRQRTNDAPLSPLRRLRWGRVGLVVVGIMVVLGVVGVSCGLYFANSLNERLDRTDAFGGLTGGRPPKVVDGALNILVLGSDGRAPGQDPGVDGERSDSVMLLHLPASHDKAYTVSIPRDTYIDIPKHKGHGGKKAKINAAYAWGGIPLVVKTMEKFTDVKIDHVVKVDFGGFKTMTDAVGGVDVMVDETVYDPRSERTFQAGWNHLDGDAALDYVRQRYNLPNGDFDRMQRQQIFLKALMRKASDSGMLKSPTKLKKFLESAADSMTVDKDFSLVDLALQFKGIGMSDLAFVTMPFDGFGEANGESVVLVDKKAARSLFNAIKQDKIADWLKDNPPNNTENGR